MRHLPDVLAVIGAALIVSGVAMMHIPSAYVLAGAATIAFGYSLSRSRE